MNVRRAGFFVSRGRPPAQWLSRYNFFGGTTGRDSQNSTLEKEKTVGDETLLKPPRRDTKDVLRFKPFVSEDAPQRLRWMLEGTRLFGRSLAIAFSSAVLSIV
jgi:hypothetical protein